MDIRSTPRRRARLAWPAAALLLGLAPLPATAQAPSPIILHDADGLTVRGHVQVGLNLVIEQNLFWNFGETVAKAEGFKSDTTWLEGYVKPGLSFSKTLDGGWTGYGKVSLIASGTLGQDAFFAQDTGRVTLEEGFLGLKSEREDGLSVDLSIGPREYVAGTGMLIANGGSSGFERGALKLGPQRAWGMAGLATARFKGFSGTAFYISPNDLPKNDSGTKIAGLDLRYDGPEDIYAGVTLGKVLESSAPYPKAAPGGIGVPSILPGARDGLTFVNAYGRVFPHRSKDHIFYIAADGALERNGDIDLKAWAWRFQTGLVFAGRPWSPTVTYSYKSFSGDDPSTSRLERFDPLYYEGNPTAWSSGSKSSMVFINSNINAHQLSLRVTPTPRDTLTLRLARINANELLSPIQFGQATRVDIVGDAPNPIAGVTRRHLSDDVFLEYNRVLTPNLYLGAGLAISFPGAGIDSIVPSKTPTWTGAYINLVADF